MAIMKHSAEDIAARGGLYEVAKAVRSEKSVCEVPECRDNPADSLRRGAVVRHG